MLRDRLEDIKTRKNYYRNNYRRLLIALLLCFAIMIVLIMIILYLFFKQPEPQYYATSSNGQLMQVGTVPRGTGLPEVQQ